jgi:multiple antibiotic resistance protein
MLEAARNLFLIVTALVPIVDPLGGSAFFLSMTSEYPREGQRALAWRIAVNSFVLLIASYFVGTYILAFFGISLPIVQVGGGIVLVAMGWAMLMEQDKGCDASNRKQIHPQDAVRQAFYPLTLPLTVGPGSISVAITLGANAAHSYARHPLIVLAALIGSALIALSIFLCYGFADRLARVLGETGMSVMIKLSSFLLVCIGAQIVWNGVKALLDSVTVHIAS